MQQTFCHRLGLVAILVILWVWPTQAAHAQSSTHKTLQRYDWEGTGASRGGIALSLELKFTRKASRASLSVYWPLYRRFTARRVSVKVSKLPLGKRKGQAKGLRIKARFSDTHPTYKYKSSTGIYCHIPSRDFLRSHQFRCKLQYSGWILMHRKGVKPRPMSTQPPARPPSLKKRPPPRRPPAARPPSRTRQPSLVGCWMKSISGSGARRKIRSLLIKKAGQFRWIQGRRQITSRGHYTVHGPHLLLLNPKRTHGQRWRFTLTRCMPRRPNQPCLQLHKPQTIRRTRHGKLLPQGRAGTKSHLFMRVGSHPNCR